MNLATRPTPMVEQAAGRPQAHAEAHRRSTRRRWREIQVPNEKYAAEAVQKAIDGLDALEAEMVKEQRKEARPKARKYVLEPKG